LHLAVSGWEYFDEAGYGRGYLDTRPVGAPYGRRVASRRRSGHEESDFEAFYCVERSYCALGIVVE
jgi:hypothetical protein